MSVVQPLAQATFKPPEHGRIRMGKKVPAKTQGKFRPEKLDTFRFTSTDEKALGQIAGMYGGQVQPWHDDRAVPKDQFEVIIEEPKVRVWLLGGMDPCSQWYELWDGGGCLRRCDGETCSVPVEIDQWNSEWQETPCLCENQDHAMVCRLTTRLAVILPGVDMGGLWRLESKGEQAGAELPSMGSLMFAFQTASGRPIDATLELTQRESMGGRRKYVVPKLSLVNTPEELMQGASVQIAGALPEPGERVAELPHQAGIQSARAALSPATRPDEEIAEAEIVEDPAEMIEFIVAATVRLAGMPWARELILAASDIEVGLALYKSQSRVSNLEELSEDQLVQLCDGVRMLEAGEVVVTGTTDKGALRMKANREET